MFASFCTLMKQTEPTPAGVSSGKRLPVKNKPGKFMAVNLPDAAGRAFGARSRAAWYLTGAFILTTNLQNVKTESRPDIKKRSSDRARGSDLSTG